MLNCFEINACYAAGMINTLDASSHQCYLQPRKHNPHAVFLQSLGTRQ